MPLTPHEQRILEEIEKRLAEEDPRLVESVARSTLASHALRRIRWGIAGFAVGFILLVLFVINLWAAVAGFGVMLASGLMVYTYLKRMGRDQLRSIERGAGSRSRRRSPGSPSDSATTAARAERGPSITSAFERLRSRWSRARLAHAFPRGLKRPSHFPSGEAFPRAPPGPCW